MIVLVFCECKHRIDGKNRKKGNTQSIKIVLHICLYEDNVSMLLYVQMLNFFLLSFFIENFFRCRYPKKFFSYFFSLLLFFTSPPFECQVDSFNFYSLFFYCAGAFSSLRYYPSQYLQFLDILLAEIDSSFMIGDFFGRKILLKGQIR